MSEIRFPSQSFYTNPFAPSGPMGPGEGGLPGFSEGLLTTESGPTFAAGSPFSLLTGSPASNPEAASSVVGFQAGTAASFTGPTQQQQEEPLKPAEQAAKGVSTAASGTTDVMRALGRGAGRLGHTMGVFGSAAGVAGEAFALPTNFNKMTSSIGTAFETGQRDDIVRASGATTEFGAGGASLVRDGIEGAGAWVKGSARRQAATAFRQAAPGASREVVTAASRRAAEEAMKDTTEAAARKATTQAATAAAKQGGTLAQGTGTANRQAAKQVLKQGGQEAAEAATKAVGKSALKTVAKAGARFVPGLNIGIAALDTATAASTLADPKAGVGKKATSVITAAGSIVAATNIPIVSQVGAGVSAVSSFVGSFFN